MTNQTLSTALRPRSFAIRLGVTTLATGVVIAVLAGPRGLAALARMTAGARLHAPDFGLIATAALPVQIHLATVLTALMLMTVQMLGPKGRTSHRALGWILSILLAITALVSLFIRDRTGALFNPFQIFAVWTLIAVPWAILSARGHNVRRHARIMTGLYTGGMLIAGALTFLPGRLMWRGFFG